MARVSHHASLFLSPNQYDPEADGITVERAQVLDDGSDVWTVNGHDGIVIYGSPQELIAFSEQLKAAAIAKLSERMADTIRAESAESTSMHIPPPCMCGHSIDEHTNGVDHCVACTGCTSYVPWATDAEADDDHVMEQITTGGQF